MRTKSIHRFARPVKNTPAAQGTIAMRPHRGYGRATAAVRASRGHGKSNSKPVTHPQAAHANVLLLMAAIRMKGSMSAGQEEN
jgi:hypothetical protein